MQTRTCRKCKIEKEFPSCFYRQPDLLSGEKSYETRCKDCHSRTTSEHIRKNYDPKKGRANYLKRKASGRAKKDDDRMRELKRRWENSSGDIEVRQTDNCGIVEIMHYWDKNNSGCVIGYWELKKVDRENEAEFHSVGDRLANTSYDSADILLEALKFGQKLADVIVKSNE